MSSAGTQLAAQSCECERVLTGGNSWCYCLSTHCADTRLSKRLHMPARSAQTLYRWPCHAPR